MSADIPNALLERVPVESRNRACICRACVAAFHAECNARAGTPLQPGDYYFDRARRMVFTAAYHLRRGHCCGSGCRHCPYPPAR